MPQLEEKQTTVTLKLMKKRGEKITAMTAYDFPTAKIIADAGMDIILVGDSLGMTVQGRKNTFKVTLDDMIYHTSLVARAEVNSFLVSDMPFKSYHVSIDKSVENACRLVQEGGAEAVKIEGGKKRFQVIEAILNAEIPVMGHLGLTPQSILKFGGFKVQGKSKEKARELMDDAKELEKLGVFALVLESMPWELAKIITESVCIPTIGIGAGKYCDGQILVFHDLLGFIKGEHPRFVRAYADIYQVIFDALTRYMDDVRQNRFPDEHESYELNKSIEELLK